MVGFEKGVNMKSILRELPNGNARELAISDLDAMGRPELKDRIIKTVHAAHDEGFNEGERHGEQTANNDAAEHINALLDLIEKPDQFDARSKVKIANEAKLWRKNHVEK